MKSNHLALSVLAALAIGLAQSILLVSAWAYIAAYSPLPTWLLSIGMSGIPWQATIYALDLAVNVLLFIPAAYLLSLLRPRNMLLYLSLAVVPGFVWQYALVFENPSAFSPLLPFVPGIITALFVLPLATLVVSRVTRRENV